MMLCLLEENKLLSYDDPCALILFEKIIMCRKCSMHASRAAVSGTVRGKNL